MENLSFEIEAKLKKLNKGLDKASSQIDSFAKRNEKRLKQFGQSMTNVGQKMTVGLTLPILGLGAAAIKSASDFQETESKFNTVFRNVSAEAQKSGEILRNEFGLSQRASLDLLGSTGDLLTGFGFTQQSALELSTEVNKLAVDLASFTNFSGGAEGASQALTKALLGERESVKSLGISILEADVQAKVLENTQKGLTFETERQAKAFATLQIAQEQSKNAIGDFARTSGSFANQMRTLRARLEDLGNEFGKILLPFAQKLATEIGKLVDWFSKLDDRTKKIIAVVSGLVAVVGPLLIALGGLVSVLPAILSGLAVLTGPIGLIVAGVVALTVAIVKNWNTVKAWVQDIVNWFIDLYNESIIFRAGIENLIFQFKTMFNVAKFVLGALWTIVKTNFKLIGNVFKTTGELLAAIFTLDGQRIKSAITDFKDTFVDTATSAFDEISNQAVELFDNVATDFDKSIDNAINGQREPIDLSASDESKEQLTNDVAEAVSEGAKQGIGRAQTQAIGNLASQGVQQGQNKPTSTSEIPNIITDASAKLGIETANMEARLLEFSQTANDIIQNNLVDAFAGLGQVIGNALSGGGNVLQGFGQLVLGIMGNLLTQLGKQAIVLGLTLEGVKKALLSFGGIGAIAIGTVAVALGKAFSNKAASLGQSLGNGSGGTGATTTRGGVDNNFSQSFAADREIILRVRGRDLVAVLNNQTNFNNAIG